MSDEETETWSEPGQPSDFRQLLDDDGELLEDADPPDLSDEELVGFYRTMTATRTLEEKMLNMQRSGEASLVARSLGEEATALGAAAALDEDDWVFYTYRQNSALLHWDVPMAKLILGVTGQAPETVEEGLGDWESPVNFSPDYTPVGVNVTNAAGSAMTDKFRDRDNVSLAFIGDGSTSEGSFHDGMNFAGVFEAPVVVVVQNNQWAISEPSKRQTGAETFAKKAEAYGVPHERVDGNDVLAVHEAAQEAVERAREGGGATLIECVTYRMGNHNTSDNASLYREEEELKEEWADRDPIERFSSYLDGEGLLDDDDREEIQAEIDEEVDDAVGTARDVPDSDPMRMFDHHLHGTSWRETHQRTEFQRERDGENPFTDFTGDEFDTEQWADEGPSLGVDASPLDPDEADTETMNIVSAVNRTLHQEMDRDDSTRILGYDIGPLGGVFRATDGLLDEFGDGRVIDTPLSENGILGTAAGMAMRDDRPIPEIEFMGFFYPAFGQFMYAVAKMYKRTGGDVEMPMTIRMPYGGGIKALEYHQESTETFEIHAPGVRVVCPSTPYQTKGLLASSIRCDDPVVFMEPKRIYRGTEGEVPTEEYTLPLDEARVVNEGEDVTVLTWGAMLPHAKQAAESVDADAEVIDLVTLSPLDVETILESVKKTGRCVVVQESRRTLGLGSELSALLNEYALDRLKAPVKRASGYDVHFPSNDIEDDYLTDAARAEHAIEAVMSYEF
ncbi:pyruvate dehydrogenase (acetyl-transferring) E1 component subunit alpha [Halogeometricum pallidum JCM 14848]|uniref:3-methyl-2-oxobutanoate dehydrogenase (2-methylpropanoyl-transferring) n=1 Tax=Halogeometricum pallidum JCM 14848 TaxID=1227487 RepID=M0CXS2_HALPD|nr:pyruvate dehydrogenase (acetyl-transferring) E1 component subunit alpha [Halogeometricum pallidum JCM 14848]